MRRGDLRLLLAMLAVAAAALAAPTARRRRDEHRDDPGRNGSSSAAGQAMVSFQGYKVLRVVPATERQVLDLQSYLQDHPTVSEIQCCYLEPTQVMAHKLKVLDLKVNRSSFHGRIEMHW